MEESACILGGSRLKDVEDGIVDSAHHFKQNQQSTFAATRSEHHFGLFPSLPHPMNW